MSKEAMNKSIDAMIDDLFAEETPVEKSIDISKDAKTTADAAVNQAPKGQDDDKRGAGRPKQISDVPKTDTDGKRAKKYDDDITENEDKEMSPEESKKQADKNRSDQTMKKSISDEEYAEYQELKKAKEEAEKAEELKKAEEAQADLIKSAVAEATSKISEENEELKKSLKETQEMVKAMAERPQRRKSVSNIQAVEKGQSADEAAAGGSQGESFSKSEMLDAAEELALNKSCPEFKIDHVTELEQTGYIYEPHVRKIFEDHLKNRKN